MLCRYGYYFNQTSQFPKDEFEKACINNIKQKYNQIKQNIEKYFVRLMKYTYIHNQVKVKITKLYL